MILLYKAVLVAAIRALGRPAVQLPRLYDKIKILCAGYVLYFVWPVGGKRHRRFAVPPPARKKSRLYGKPFGVVVVVDRGSLVALRAAR